MIVIAKILSEKYNSMVKGKDKLYLVNRLQFYPILIHLMMAVFNYMLTLIKRHILKLFGHTGDFYRRRL